MVPDGCWTGPWVLLWALPRLQSPASINLVERAEVVAKGKRRARRDRKSPPKSPKNSAKSPKKRRALRDRATATSNPSKLPPRIQAAIARTKAARKELDALIAGAPAMPEIDSLPVTVKLGPSAREKALERNKGLSQKATRKTCECCPDGCQNLINGKSNGRWLKRCGCKLLRSLAKRLPGPPAAAMQAG